MEVVTKNRSKIRYKRRSKFTPTRTTSSVRTSLYANPNANETPFKNETVTGILDLLDYTRKIAWLMHTNRQGMFKFSEEFVGPLRQLWGKRVKCVVNPNNELVQISDARKRPKRTSLRSILSQQARYFGESDAKSLQSILSQPAQYFAVQAQSCGSGTGKNGHLGESDTRRRPQETSKQLQPTWR
jgi:hypothetical protein